MDNLFIRSISGEALRAELHRSDLLAEAANNRLARVSVHTPDLEWPRRDERAGSHAQRPR